MDLVELVRLVWRRKRLLLTFALVSALAALLLGALLVSYEAKAQFLLRPIGLDGFNAGPSWSTIPAEAVRPSLGMVYSPRLSVVETQSNSYIRILTSRPVVQQVVESLGLDRSFQASDSWAARLIDLIKQPARLLYYGRLPAIEHTPVDKAIDKTQLKIRAKLIPNSSVIRVTVKDRKAERAAMIANALLDALLAHSSQLNAERSQAVGSFLEAQLAATRDELQAKQELSAELKERRGFDRFTQYSSEQTKVDARLAKAEDQRDLIEESRGRLRDTVAQLERALGRYPEYKTFSSTMGSNLAYTTLKNQLVQLRLQRERSLYDYTPDSAQVKGIERQVAAAEQALADETARMLTAEVSQTSPVYQDLLQQKVTAENDLALAPHLLRLMEQRIGEYKDRLGEVEAGSLEEAAIVVAITTLKRQEEQLGGSLSTVRLLEARGLREVEILERAIVPRYPSLRGAPLSFYVVIGLLGGLILGTAYLVWKTEFGSAESEGDD